MAHIVKCSVCGKSFDRDKIQAVKTGGRRYAHQTCDPQNDNLAPVPVLTQNQMVNEIINISKQIFGDKLNLAKTKKYAKQFLGKEYNFTYTGIIKTLEYFFIIKNNSIDKANGSIGIVPFVYDESKQYYFDIYKAKQYADNIPMINHNITNQIYINEPVKKIPKLFNLEEEIDSV